MQCGMALDASRADLRRAMDAAPLIVLHTACCVLVSLVLQWSPCRMCDVGIAAHLHRLLFPDSALLLVHDWELEVHRALGSRDGDDLLRIG
jgi:hypothetical protein